MGCPPTKTADIEELFRHEVFKMLKAEGKINDTVIEKILRHLGLWETRNHDPPVRNASHIPEFTYDDDYSQVLSEPEAL